MKKSRFSEAQIVSILKEVEMGVKVGDTCIKLGVSEPTYYKWKSQFSVRIQPVDATHSLNISAVEVQT